MSLPRPTMVMIGSRPSACSEVVRWSGLPRDVYCPEISTKSALFPRFGHKGNRSDHRALIVVRPRNGGVDAQDAMGRRLFVGLGQVHLLGVRLTPWSSSGSIGLPWAGQSAVSGGGSAAVSHVDVGEAGHVERATRPMPS